MNIVINNLQKADCFASIFQHIKVFTDQVNIVFEKEQLFLQTMDSAHVSIFEIAIPSEWFDIYEHKQPSSITLGISASILFKILNAKDKNQILNIVYNENNSDTLAIHFTGETKTNFDKHFEIPLIDIECETMDIPIIEYQAEFTIPSGNFANIVNQLKMFGDTMDIKCSEENIILYSHSQDNGKMFVEMNIDDLNSFAIDEGEKLNLSFSLNYLHNICLYNKLSKEVEIKLRSEYPVKIIYDLGENAKITFYLAPKIDDE